MDINKLIMIVSLILALSIASERLVEIIKGFCKYLNIKKEDAKAEGYRCAILHIIAVVAGMLTAWIASPAIPKEITDAAGFFSIPAIGLLVSGGSGFWNSVLTYLLKIKDIKGVEAKEKEMERKNNEIEHLDKVKNSSLPEGVKQRYINAIK